MTEKNLEKKLNYDSTRRDAVIAVESGDHLSNGVSSKNQRSRRNLLSLLSTVIALIFTITSCNKSEIVNDSNQPILTTTNPSGMVPIAKLTDANEIEHLFLQRDVQACFSRENPGQKLVFVEVKDDGKNGLEAGLLYSIYYEENAVKETSIIPVITLRENIYYFVPPGGGSVSKTSCTTSECITETKGCQPNWNGTCTPCKNGGKCTRTTTLVTGTMPELTDAIYYAISAY